MSHRGAPSGPRGTSVGRPAEIGAPLVTHAPLAPQHDRRGAVTFPWLWRQRLPGRRITASKPPGGERVGGLGRRSRRGDDELAEVEVAEGDGAAGAGDGVDVDT